MLWPPDWERQQKKISEERIVRYAGIADHVEITEGKGGLPTVVLKHACGSKAEV